MASFRAIPHRQFALHSKSVCFLCVCRWQTQIVIIGVWQHNGSHFFFTFCLMCLYPNPHCWNQLNIQQQHWCFSAAVFAPDNGPDSKYCRHRDTKTWQRGFQVEKYHSDPLSSPKVKTYVTSPDLRRLISVSCTVATWSSGSSGVTSRVPLPETHSNILISMHITFSTMSQVSWCSWHTAGNAVFQMPLWYTSDSSSGI